jgi:hypothetical protein
MATMVDGIIDAATVIDAQVNYEVPKLKSTLKPAQNTEVLGAGLIGQQYFASWTINP